MKRKKDRTNSGTPFTPERTESEEGKMDVDNENDIVIVEQSPTLIPNVATVEDFKIDLNQSSPRSNQDSLQQEQQDDDEKKRRIG